MITPECNNPNTTEMLDRIFTAFPILKTKRLLLRQPVINDEQEIFILRSDRRINKYLDRQLSNTIADARNFITTVNENINKKVSVYWAITLREEHIFVGTICLYDFSDENETCEIGYELLPTFEGQGIMNEAIVKVIDYAFNKIKVKKIEAFLHKDNQRSVNLLEKLSFRNSNKPDAQTSDVIGFHLAGENFK